MYRYLTIRSDASYSQFALTEELVGLLATLPGLRQSGPMSFEAAPGSPWVSVILAECDALGSYACDGLPRRRVNLVEVIGSASGDDEWYESLAARMAAFLRWETIEEHEGRRLSSSNESRPN
jgi:hypothetical protein